MSTSEHFPQFFTATINKWIKVLQPDCCKNIIIDSLEFLVFKKRVTIYAFVVMPNHIHLIWKISDGFQLKNVQRDFLKYTGQQIKFYLQKQNPTLLESLKVNSKDRAYQIWQRNSLSVDLYSEYIFEQKLDYLHHNPCKYKWRLALYPEDYLYSSAKFYENDYSDKYKFVFHYKVE